MMTRSAVRGLRLAGFAGVIAGVVLSAGTAYAEWADAPETGLTGHLALRTLDLPNEALLAPGTSLDFVIEASLTDAEHASLALQLRADGALVTMPHGLRIRVESC
ncbi:MAG TPA: hypothetical protein VNP97_07630, partial [Microbacterium sp.]|nr:hypothetical protein [Microbacterium sp.]